MSPVRMGKIESTMRVVMAFNEALNRHDVDAMMAWMSEDCLFDNTYPPPDGTLVQGKPAVTAFWREFFQASPNAHIAAEDIFSFRDRCIVRWRYEWVDEQGQPGHVRGVDLFLVRDGLIREKRSYVKG